MVFYFFIRKSLPKIIFSVSFYLLSPSSSLGTVAGDHLSSSSAARAGLGAACSLGAVQAEPCCRCAVVWGPGTFGAAQGSQGRWSVVWPGWLAVCSTTPRALQQPSCLLACSHHRQRWRLASSNSLLLGARALLMLPKWLGSVLGLTSGPLPGLVATWPPMPSGKLVATSVLRLITLWPACPTEGLWQPFITIQTPLPTGLIQHLGNAQELE